MAIITPGINLVKSFNFIREFQRNIIKNTDVNLRKRGANIAQSAYDTDLSPREISDKVENYKIKIQKTKNSQDRFIDTYR
ncbi:hypothetical protein ACFL4T_06960 [candidate division KSB1 bacterium]